MSKKLTVSQRGLDLIGQFESCAFDLYVCPAGKRTIGYGHVLRPSEKFTHITMEQAKTLLIADCNIAEIYLNSVNLPAPLNQNQFDALVCLVFNIGVGNFDQSTLLKRLKQGELPLAAEQFLVWNKIRVNGELVFSRGLHRRRCMERELFLESIKE